MALRKQLIGDFLLISIIVIGSQFIMNYAFEEESAPLEELFSLRKVFVLSTGIIISVLLLYLFRKSVLRNSQNKK